VLLAATARCHGGDVSVVETYEYSGDDHPVHASAVGLEANEVLAPPLATARLAQYAVRTTDTGSLCMPASAGVHDQAGQDVVKGHAHCWVGVCT
jgi:hypothetical protein